MLKKIKIIKANKINHIGKVYDIELEKNHYFKANDIWTHNCRLKFKIEDQSIFKNPEKIRFVGFQNVTINLPQAAYRSKKNFDKLIEEIEWAMDIAMKAHIQKKAFISKLMKKKGDPLWQVGKPSLDGEPYINLEKASYIIGMVGLNECVKYMTGEELHESEGAYRIGIKIVSAMFLKTKKLTEENKLKVVLEESPAESATYRLAKVDLMQYPESKDYMLGNTEKADNIFYSNSIHYRADAPISLIDRIIGQSKFHSLIEAGAIVHAFVGETLPNPKSIYSLVEKTYKNTQCAQLTISPVFCHCEDCHNVWKE